MAACASLLEKLDAKQQQRDAQSQVDRRQYPAAGVPEPFKGVFHGEDPMIFESAQL